MTTYRKGWEGPRPEAEMNKEISGSAETYECPNYRHGPVQGG